MNPIKVLLVDDSSLAREMLREILEHEQDIVVIGEAVDGRDAIEKAQTLHPDLITMDLEMPVMNGIEAISEIMCSKAVPILVVSGASDAEKAYLAICRGALDVVNKADITSTCIKEFISKIRMLAGVPVITHIRQNKNDHNTLEPPSAPTIKKILEAVVQPAQAYSSKIFAIASSTGGPQVLEKILTQLPANFSCPVFIAQHIAEGFASGMTNWLNQICKLPVKIAQNGEQIQAGTVYIAQPESHCTVLSTHQIALIPSHKQDTYHPSCDRLLDSVADVYKDKAVGIIMTGMGHDGASGIAKILANGGTTIGQDEATSLIYGMNYCAISAGSVQKCLPDHAIAEEMIHLAGF